MILIKGGKTCPHLNISTINSFGTLFAIGRHAAPYEDKKIKENGDVMPD